MAQKQIETDTKPVTVEETLIKPWQGGLVTGVAGGVAGIYIT